MRGIIASLLLAGALTACGDSFGIDTVSGEYMLRSVNGTMLPFSENITIDGVSVTAEFTSGFLDLNDGGDWLVSFTITLTDGNSSISDTQTASGTFTVEDPSTIRFTESTSGGTFTGTWTEGRVTVIDDGDTFVFES